MPTLRETQRAMQRSLVHREDDSAASQLATHITRDRLDIYRNTFIASLTNALRLAFPVVDRLVGGEFFEGTAARFIAAHPPRSAYLNFYGAAFPEFLERFPAAAALGYLPDVARLEWAVNAALHAADQEPFDPTTLMALAPEMHARLRFTPHPSVGLLRSDYPVDAIWKAVLDRDDTALTSLRFDDACVHLLVERGPAGVSVTRLAQASWQFAQRLFAGHLLEDVLQSAANIDAVAELAIHIGAGRVAGFTVAPAEHAGDERAQASMGESE